MAATAWGERAAGMVKALTRTWALLGGMVILAVVALNVYSVLLVILFDRPFPGAYEIVQIGVAVGMFMFLPYCQITGSNVTADIFTAGVGPRALAVLGGLGALFALVFAGVLLWRMFFGLLDLRMYRETTAIYQFPLWQAYVPILVSLALMVLAAIVNLYQAARGEVPEELESA